MIPFNKPHSTGKEAEYIQQAIAAGKFSGDGSFTKKCHEFFETTYGFKKVLLTSSCTDALEMSAILFDIKDGDEVIMPSFAFVSVANAFVLRGAKIIFADSSVDNPNMDVTQLEQLISSRTKVIVALHYAGVACDMDAIMSLAEKYHLFVVEDAAHAIDSFYKGKRLGSIGHLAAFSFHETKNIICGEGGMLVINDERFIQRAEIIREKGTNRSMFFRGEVAKYSWVDIGSSFLPSDLLAAFLYAQINSLDEIQSKRKNIEQRYHDGLSNLKIGIPQLLEYATRSGHLFYLLCKNEAERVSLTAFLKERGVAATFHFLPLHLSEYFASKHDGRFLFNAEKFADCLLRLPLYPDLTEEEQDHIIQAIHDFYKK